jgi:hypothetical protein
VVGGRVGRLRVSLVIAVAGAVLSGCPTSDGQLDEHSDDPWTSQVSYRDPDGLFEIDFPVEPESAEEIQGPANAQLVLHSLTASVDDDLQFILAWSDAPAGTALVRTQAIREQTPEENAESDDGVVIDEREAEMFGRTGLAFTVEGDGGSGFYHDIQVVLGGRLYELTVIQRDDSREAFDRFVESFHLLQPPLDDDADFFATAEQLCSAFFDSLGDPPQEATPAERGAAMGEITTFYEGLLAELVVTPAAAGVQGDAAAFIDSIRRSIGPARTFAEAVAADTPDAEDLGSATHADTDLTEQLAEANGAPSCA